MNDLQKRQILIFVTGWIAYASTYLLRKPLGVIKSDLPFSQVELGWLDLALLMPYAAVQIFLGSIGDKLGPTFTLAVGMILSGLALITFSFWTNYLVIFMMLAFSGAAQGLCWPNVCKIIGSWYSDKSRNSMFGFLGASAFGGGIAGTLLAVYLQWKYGWNHVFFLPSLISICLGILVYMLLKMPSDVNIIVPGKEVTLQSLQKQSHSLLQLWRIPMVTEISIAMFCLKLVRYCMYMWLPLYLTVHLNYTKEMAGLFSTIFEIGGVFGSVLLGIAIDKFFGGECLVGTFASSLVSTVSLLLFFLTGKFGLLFNAVFMVIAGALNCGPDTILGGSLPSEIGDSNELNAAAAVTGLVNGFGSIGACLEGPIIGFVSARFGWDGMFYFLLLLSTLGTLAIYRARIINTKLKKIYLPLVNEDGSQSA